MVTCTIALSTSPPFISYSWTCFDWIFCIFEKLWHVWDLIWHFLFDEEGNESFRCPRSFNFGLSRFGFESGRRGLKRFGGNHYMFGTIIKDIRILAFLLVMYSPFDRLYTYENFLGFTFSTTSSFASRIAIDLRAQMGSGPSQISRKYRWFWYLGPVPHSIFCT